LKKKDFKLKYKQYKKASKIKDEYEKVKFLLELKKLELLLIKDEKVSNF
jgi:hypothetical protein